MEDVGAASMSSGLVRCIDQYIKRSPRGAKSFSENQFEGVVRQFFQELGSGLQIFSVGNFLNCQMKAKLDCKRQLMVRFGGQPSAARKRMFKSLRTCYSAGSPIY